MLTGKCIRLRAPAVVIDFSTGAPLRVTVPKGAILTVVSDPGEAGQLLDVLWDGHLVYIAKREVGGPDDEVADRDMQIESPKCSVCDSMLTWYERSVHAYSNAVRSISGAVGSDFVLAFTKAEGLREAGEEAKDRLMAHFRAEHGFTRPAP